MDNLTNLRLDVEYDGCRYSGWQTQPGHDSIQGEIERALSTILREPVKVMGSGRTDAGVHAKGQVANFRIAGEIDVQELRHRANSVLPNDIVVRDIAVAAKDFDARRSARKRTYGYSILNRPFPSAFWRRYSWWIRRPLDIEKMVAAGTALVGVHEFSGFTVAKIGPKTREIFGVEVCADKQTEVVMIRICANAFLHHMVRLIVGTLVEVGVGNLDASIVERILVTGDIKLAGPRAPAKGLCLEKVEY